MLVYPFCQEEITQCKTAVAWCLGVMGKASMRWSHSCAFDSLGHTGWKFLHPETKWTPVQDRLSATELSQLVPTPSAPMLRQEYRTPPPKICTYVM